MTHQHENAAVLVRTFNATPERVFDAWTQTQHLNQWMFPMPGCRCEFVDADIRSGGTSLHKIIMPNGAEMWLYTTYETVARPEQLVFFQYMSNEAGDKLPNPRVPNWPMDIRATLTFTAVADNQCELTFVWEPIGASAAEQQTFNDMREQNGWAAGMDMLERYLAGDLA